MKNTPAGKGPRETRLAAKLRQMSDDIRILKQRRHHDSPPPPPSGGSGVGFRHGTGDQSVIGGDLDNEAIANGTYDLAIGNGAFAGHHEWQEGDLSDSHTAVGYFSDASGGDNATAYGANSLAQGRNTTALGPGADAEGEGTTAAGHGAGAAGDGAAAFGEYASASGEGALALGGGGAGALADRSFVVGYRGIVIEEDMGELRANRVRIMPSVPLPHTSELGLFAETGWDPHWIGVTPDGGLTVDGVLIGGGGGGGTECCDAIAIFGHWVSLDSHYTVSPDGQTVIDRGATTVEMVAAPVGPVHGNSQFTLHQTGADLSGGGGYYFVTRDPALSASHVTDSAQHNVSATFTLPFVGDDVAPAGTGSVEMRGWDGTPFARYLFTTSPLTRDLEIRLAAVEATAVGAWHEDEVDVGPGSTSVVFSMTPDPVPISIQVWLNGLLLRRDVDWDFSDPDPGAAELTVPDLVEGDYVVLRWQEEV